MARASTTGSSRSFNREEEEERKRREAEAKAAAEAAEQAAAAEPAKVEVPKQPENVKIEKTDGGVKAHIGPTNRRNDPTMFDLMANNAYKEATTKVVKAGELDMLPAELQDDAQALTKKAGQNKLSPKTTGRWSSEDTDIRVDYNSIKNETHAGYFAANLANDKQKLKFFTEYADKKGLDLQTVLYNAEQLHGSKLFDSPQSNKGKLAAAGLYNFDGTELDPNTITSAESLRALRMTPDDDPNKAAAKKAHIAMFGYLPDEEFDFMDTADLTKDDYKDEVDSFKSAFVFSNGVTDQNRTAYEEQLDRINNYYSDRNPWVAKKLKSALDREFAARTGVLPPDENELRRLREKAAAAEAALAENDTEDNRNWFQKTVDAISGLFEKGEKAPKAEEPQEQEDEEAPEAGAVVRPGYYASTGVASGGSSAPASTYAAAGSAPEIQGPVYQPQAAEPEEPEEPAEVQGPVYQPQAQEEAPQESSEPRYVNAIAYDPDMTDEQAIAYVLSGYKLDKRNREQIGWALDNKETLGILNYSAPGFKMPSVMNNTEAKMHRTFSVYGHYGSAIGSAAMAINSGELPNGVRNVASLELMQIVAEIGEAVANPQNRISVPKGKNMYDYFLSLPQGEPHKKRVQAVNDSLKNTNDAYAAASLDEAKAQKRQIEKDLAMVLAGIGGDPAMERLAQNNPTPAQIENDPTRTAWRKEMSFDSKFFADDGAFWQNGSAAAQEGKNILAANGGRTELYTQYKVMLHDETNAVIDECTSMAVQCDISLKEYFDSIGIESLDQVVDIAYCRMLEKGNAYAEDEEAQEATQAIGKWNAVVSGGEHGLTSTGANLMNTAYMVVDNATYEQSRATIMDDYYSKYGDPEMAAYMYRSDLTAYAKSGQMSQRAAQDLLLNMDQVRNIFDIAYEIDPGFLESLTRNGAESLQKRTEELEEIAAKLPEGERTLFNLASGATGTISGMGVAAGVGLLTGSPFVGAAVAYGMPAYSEAYYENRWLGMSPGMSKFAALGNAAIATMMNVGGAGSQMDNILGGTAYQGMKKALASEGTIGWIKAMGKHTAKLGVGKGLEELGDFAAGTAFDLLDKDFLALDSGAAPSLSRAYSNVVDSLYELDPEALAKEAAYSFGTGVLFGTVFSVYGAGKTGLAARKGYKAETEYKSVGLSTQLVEGKAPINDQTMGDFFVALREDLKNPEYRRWIDSKNIAAMDQKAAVAAMMMGEGEESRAKAAEEVKKAGEYKVKAEAAAEASATALDEYYTARERLMEGDLEADVEAEGALDRWGKAETARQEAESAAAKAEQNATDAMSLWLKECRIAAPKIKAEMLDARMKTIAQARLEEAQRLAAQYEAEEAKTTAEVEYAESQIFPDEEWTEEAQEEEAENRTDDELDADVADINAQIADAEARIADVTSRSEELGIDGETVQAMTEQELAPLSKRKEGMIAREKARFNNAFERMQTALENDDGDAADQIAAEYDRIGERLSALGVNTDALIAEQYGYDVNDVNEAAEAAQAQEAQRAETEKHERLTETLERQMAETAMKREQNAPARQYLMTRPIYVNESQAADILAAEGLKSIAQVNRRYHMQLTTDESANAMPLDGHVMNDINREAAGSVDESADPVGELLRVMQTGKELSAEQKQQQAQAKELQAKRKAADKRRRESVDALTGRNAEPVRQANQINALVANENSTVEQIDNAVDRIEGVSMSMNDGAEATVNQEQETLVESGYKDPAMQKLASDLYKNWGVRLRTADLDPRDEGFYDRDSNTIVLNKRLTSGERQRTVVMHELIHFCEAQPWYPQFKKDILAGAYSGEAEIEENRERLRDMGYAEKDLDFELVSHAAKPLFEGDEVLVGNLLENGKASAVKRAYAAIAQYIARRKAKKMGMGKQYDALLSARKTLAKGLKNAKATKANNYSAGGSVSHSYSGPVLSQYGNQTAQEVDWINQAVKDQLKGSTHEVQTDRAAIAETLSRIEELGGVQDALRDLMSRPVDRWNAQDQAMAQVLMAKAEYDGDVTTEAVVAMMYDKSGSEAGLTLQKRKLLARMDSQNALALVSRLASDFNMKNGGSSQYAPVGNGRPLEKIDGAEGDANGIIDRAKRVNDAIVAERGMDDIIERDNRWGIPVTGAQMYLIERYGLSHTDLPGAHYSQATVKQRMLAAILATDTDVVYDTDVDGNRNGLLGLIQQLEAMKADKAVQTIADLTYISNQMAEMKAQSNGSEDPYLNTQEAKVALARAYDAINNVVPVTTGQRVGALAYMNMLSASTTGAKNVLGNVVMGPMEAASETIAAAIDKVVSAKTKNRTTAVSTAQETADGLKEGLAELANTFADTYIYQTDTSYGRKYEMSGDAPRVYQNAPMEAKRRMVDFIMQLGDRPFFKAEYARQMDMIQRLCKEGKMKKKDVVSTPDGRQIVSYAEMTEADMHAEAAQRALERVFQEDNAIVNWVNSAPAALRPFMQAVVPFVKTPTNIAKRMLDYSPIGLAKTLAVAGYHAAVKDGGFDQRKFVMGMGRGLTGTGMIMAGALLASLGVLDIEDGYGEEDDGKLYGTGMANYDPYGKYINIDGNKTSLDWLGAAGIWMTIGAAAAKEWDEDTGLGEAMYSTMLKSGPEILNLLFDNTMLSSVSELLGGAEDGEELGTNVVETIVGSALQQYFSPADIRQFAKFTDEYERDYRHDNPIIEAINKNVIRYWPVLRQTLPIKYDITGDVVRQSSKYGWGRQDEDVVLNFLNMYMSPTNIQSDKGDAALDEVIDLSYRLGDTSCIPSNLITTNGNITIPVTMAKKTTLGAGENKLTLSVDEQRKYNQMYASLCFNGTEKGRKYEKVGSGAYGNVRGIRDLIESREYQRADNQAKSDMIEDIMKQAKEIVRAQICIDRGYEK